MIKSFKVMLIPNNRQRSQFFNYAGAARFAYNWALRKEIDNLEKDKKFISSNQLRKELTQLKKDSNFSWLNTIDCDITKQAIKDLDKAYSRFFKLRKQKGYEPYSKDLLIRLKREGKEPTFYQSKGHPKFKSKKDYNKYGFYQDAYKISFTNTHVKLVLVAGRGKAGTKRSKNFCQIRLAEHGYIPTNVKYYNPRVTFDGLNWWISVGVEIPEDNTDTVYLNSSNDGIGIDLGIKDLAICSDKNTYKNINKSKKIKKLEKKKRRLQRKISRKYNKNKKGESYHKTKNAIKEEKLLLKLNHRLTNIRNNYIHQVTSEIVNREPKFIVLEDLNVSSMMKNKHLAKAVQKQKFYEFRRQIEYKSANKNIEVFIAPRFFPSSKTCNHCGFIKKDLKLSDRTYICPECDYIEDRDLNAAMNLCDYYRNNKSVMSA